MERNKITISTMNLMICRAVQRFWDIQKFGKVAICGWSETHITEQNSHHEELQHMEHIQKLVNDLGDDWSEIYRKTIKGAKNESKMHLECALEVLFE